MTEDQKATLAVCGIAAGVVMTVRCLRWWWRAREEKQRERSLVKRYGQPSGGRA